MPKGSSKEEPAAEKAEKAEKAAAAKASGQLPGRIFTGTSFAAAPGSDKANDDGPQVEPLAAEVCCVTRFHSSD